MGLTGWIHYNRDLRDERPAVNAMAATLRPTALRTDVVRLARNAGFAHHGPTGGYADWRHNERPDPDLALAVDGKLANRRRVEEQLYQRPRPLSSDAEVLLHAYRQWGVGLVDRIDGSYALVIWDNHARQLLLIRDPLGAKTLFYAPQRDGIVFATRATTLLAHPDVDPVVEIDGLNELLTLGPIRTPGHGVIRGVREVEPGEHVRVTPAGIRRRYYWSLAVGEHVQNLDATARFVRRAIADNTAALRAEPPGAVLLSGGVASATVAAFTTPSHHDRPGAWTLTLAGPWDLPPGTGADVGSAARTAEHLRLRHTVLCAGVDAVIDAAAATRAILDFPGESNRDATVLMLLRRVAAAGATSIVTGDGADAVFGGYQWMRHPGALAHDDFAWRHRGLTPTDLLTLDARMHLTPDGYRKQRYADAATAVPRLTGEDVVAGRHRRMAHLTLTHYLPHLLTRLDQLTTACGLTAHTPFADWLLAQYLCNVPYPLRHLLGLHNGLLRHSVADVLPADVAWLRPRPFPSADLLPLWQQSQRAHLHAIITDSNAALNPLLDRRRVTDLLTHPPTRPARDWHTTIAYLIEVNAWLTRHRIALT